MAMYLGDKPVKAIVRSKNNLLNTGALTFSGPGGARYFSLDLNGTYTLQYKTRLSQILDTDAALVRITVDGKPVYRVAYANDRPKITVTGHITAIDFLNWSAVTGIVYEIMLNEGDTALPYEPYNLLFTAPIKKCTGKNLLNIFGRTKAEYDGKFSNVSDRQFDENKYYLGISGNNYWAPDRVKEYSFEDEKLSATFASGSTGYGIGFPVRCKPNTTYVITVTANGVRRVNRGYYDIFGKYISNGINQTSNGKNSFTFTTRENCAWVVFSFGQTADGQTCEFSEIMLYEKIEALPSEYQEVEYIESTGTQYIDTGHIPTGNKSKYIIDYTIPKSSIGLSLFGNAIRVPYDITAYHRTNTEVLFFAGNSSDIFGLSTSIGQRYVINVEAGNGLIKASLSDGQTETANYTGELNNTKYIYIFGANNGERGSGYRLYSFKAYDNDNLVRNYIPCYRKADNVIGLYDLVNKVFYTNKGTGTFLKGINGKAYEPYKEWYEY